MKKMFCNDTCENLDHKKKEEAGAVVKVGQKKVEIKKKKPKGKTPKPGSGKCYYFNLG